MANEPNLILSWNGFQTNIYSTYNGIESNSLLRYLYSSFFWIILHKLLGDDDEEELQGREFLLVVDRAAVPRSQEITGLFLEIRITVFFLMKMKSSVGF